MILGLSSESWHRSDYSYGSYTAIAGLLHHRYHYYIPIFLACHNRRINLISCYLLTSCFTGLTGTKGGNFYRRRTKLPTSFGNWWQSVIKIGIQLSLTVSIDSAILDHHSFPINTCIVYMSIRMDITLMNYVSYISVMSLCLCFFTAGCTLIKYLYSVNDE